MPLRKYVAALGFAAMVAAQGNSTADILPSLTQPASSLQTACSAASSAWASAKAATPTDATVAIPPSLAVACLQSVPVDVERDIALVEYLLPYVEFQSTIGYLKNPPEGYLIPGIDVIGGFVEIRQKLRNGGYHNQYEFTWDISRIFSAAADGHFSYTPALNNAVFNFQRTLMLVSVSEDGLQLPKIYDYNDLLRSKDHGYTASDIATIDGIRITDYLIELSTLTLSQDPDAAFNNLFTNIPLKAAGNNPGFTNGSIPALPDSHAVSFTNGSSRRYENQAIVAKDLAGIDSGEKLHTAFELPPATATNSASPTATGTGSSVVGRSEATASPIPGYPQPIVINKGRYVSGYFLNDSAHQDTCVLVLYSFVGKEDGSEEETDDSTAEFFEFRRVVRSFFEACKESSRTKLVIDLSANGGGLLFEGFELYRNLFPNSINWSGTRVRANPGMDFFGKVIYGTEGFAELFSNVLDASGKPFPDWPSFFGPKVFPEDSETEVMIYDFKNASTSMASAKNPFTVTGYDQAEPVPSQPFAAEDIVILTDGVCASTCTIFTGLMTREQGVRTIALGGRPLKAPMQAIGGVKGAQVFKFSQLQSLTEGVLKAVTTKPAGLALPSINSPPLMPVVLKDAQYNFRNAYAQNATDGPPLQFVYEAANCRRFYKREYLADITQVWRDMADIAWHSAQCAPGSSINADGTIGRGVLGYTNAVVSTQRPYDGPGSLTDPTWKALNTNTTGTDANSTTTTTSGPKSSDAGASTRIGLGYILTACMLGGLVLF